MTAPSPPATVLAFDFGTRRVGVALGNTLTRSARPLTTIDEERSEPRFAAIAALIDEWHPGLLVVGVPVHDDGTPHAMTARAQRFARQLHGRFGVEVALADERHTTQAAQSVLDAEGGSGHRGRAQRDQVAAQLILQQWLDEAAAANEN